MNTSFCCCKNLGSCISSSLVAIMVVMMMMMIFHHPWFGVPREMVSGDQQLRIFDLCFEVIQCSTVSEGGKQGREGEAYHRLSSQTFVLLLCDNWVPFGHMKTAGRLPTKTLRVGVVALYRNVLMIGPIGPSVCSMKCGCLIWPLHYLSISKPIPGQLFRPPMPHRAHSYFNLFLKRQHLFLSQLCNETNTYISTSLMRPPLCHIKAIRWLCCTS